MGFPKSVADKALTACGRSCCNRGQIQVLLRELRNENRIHCIGNTNAARWFFGALQQDE